MTATSQVTLRLRDDVARALRAALSNGRADAPDTSGEAGAVRALAAEAGAALEPIAVGGAGELGHWFVATAPSPEAAHALRRRLAACAGVEAAYVKGEDAPPGG